MDRLRRLVFQRSMARRVCAHLDQVAVIEGKEPVCPECIKEGSEWVHVRMCMVCGNPACCDSSKRQHARQHFEDTGHALMRSIEPAETWAWCYVDKAYLTEDEYVPAS